MGVQVNESHIHVHLQMPGLGGNDEKVSGRSRETGRRRGAAWYLHQQHTTPTLKETT